MTNSQLCISYTIYRQMEKNPEWVNDKYKDKKSLMDRLADRKLVCYGSGIMYDCFREEYPELNVDCIIDKKARAKNYKYKGTNVTTIEHFNYDNQIVLVTCADDYKQIESCLIEKSVGIDNIFYFCGMEYCESSIREYVNKCASDDIFYMLCSNALDNRIMKKTTNQMQQTISDLRRQSGRINTYLRHTNMVMNVLISQMENNAELKKEQIRARYRYNNGVDINLDNPKTMCEKLLKYCLDHEDDPLFAKVTDKYTLREYVAEKIGSEHIVPLIGVWDSAEEIPFENLPDKFVLKATDGGDSERVLIVDDKSTIDIDDTKRTINSWMGTYSGIYYSNFNGTFKHVVNRIIAEPLIEGSKEADVWDYRFFCFHGKPFLYNVTNSEARYGKDFMMTYYDMNRKRMDNVRGNYWPDGNLADDSVYWEEMVRIAGILSEDFDFVRVDFMVTDSDYYVGELTILPGGGLRPYSEDRLERELGDLI